MDRGKKCDTFPPENTNEKELGPLEFFCGEKTFNPLTSKSKQFYRLLVSVKVKPSRGFIKLKEDFDL